MDLFLYLDRDTWLHRLDPRVKVLGAGGFFLTALLFSDPRYLAPPLALTLALITGARSWDNLRKLWPLIALPFLYCLLLWPFFVTGRTAWLSIGSHVLTREAEEYGLGMGVRLSLMVLGGILLLSTTTIEEFTLALQRLGLPVTMGFALSLAFRWVPSLIGAAGLIVQAQRSRGLDVGAGHALARLRRYPPLLVPLIGHTLRHTRFLAMALESKGFGPGVRRRELVALRLRLPDYVALACVALLVSLSLWLRLAGYGTVDVRF
jgi:energy-coupling factor transport system permease protein